jgi:hypothetical protein
MSETPSAYYPINIRHAIRYIAAPLTILALPIYRINPFRSVVSSVADMRILRHMARFTDAPRRHIYQSKHLGAALSNAVKVLEGLYEC